MLALTDFIRIIESDHCECHSFTVNIDHFRIYSNLISQDLLSLKTFRMICFEYT